MQLTLKYLYGSEYIFWTIFILNHIAIYILKNMRQKCGLRVIGIEYVGYPKEIVEKAYKRVETMEGMEGYV